MQGALTRIGAGALALTVAAGLAACGDDDKESKKSATAPSGNELAVTVTESGKAAKVTAPKTAKGGLVTVKLNNQGKQPHEAQLLQIKGDHTPEDVQKAFGEDDTSKNEWLRAAGGVGSTAPGQTGTGTVTLDPGKYMVADLSQEGDAPPAYTLVDVSAGEEGSLPTTETTVTAEEVGDDKYKWEISGPLKSGGSEITFKSEGKEAIHLIAAARLTKDVSKKEVVKALGEEGKPPPFIDEKSFSSTAILDGEKSQVTQFRFSQPGKWVLFCPLPDRGEDKPHDQQGLAEIVDVQ
ncbi:MAG TPA: hypothetical protein VJT75_05065 [Thermoleophilaceae bacterium]|nr:hypothetical protein [Thermoleophilaceae bacterium]